MQKAHYCQYGILPAENEHEHEIRKCGHNFVLPQCNSNLFKASYLKHHQKARISEFCVTAIWSTWAVCWLNWV